MSDPRYLQVARDLTEGITSGRFPVGSILPTEFELSDLYGTSRHTVRAAIKELQELGFVSRRKKLGTRVEAAAPNAAEYRSSLASVEDLVQFGEEHRRSVQEIADVVADHALAKTLGCSSGRRWLRISSLRLRSGDDAPIGWTDVYLDPEYSELRETIRDCPDTLISTLIETRYGRRIAEIRQEIEGVVVSDALAERLHVTKGSAGLRVTRRYLDNGGACFEASVTTHPADRFTISMRLRRERG